MESGSVNSYGLKKQIEIVRNTRTVTKLDMKFNNATPKMEVDPEAFVSPNSAFETLEYDTDCSITDGYGRWSALQSRCSYVATTYTSILHILTSLLFVKAPSFEFVLIYQDKQLKCTNSIYELVFDW